MRSEYCQIPDPRDMKEEEFRKVRNLIEEKVKAILEKIAIT